MPNHTEKLEYILDNVNNWLKFAEAKNGTLLAINSAFLFGIIRIILTTKLEEEFSYCIAICFLISITSVVFCLLSFLPKLKIFLPESLNSISENNKLNSIYFGDISKLKNSKIYLEYLFQENIIDNKLKNDKFALDLANQIVVNSKIAKSKYKYFVISIMFTIIYVLLLLVLISIWTFDRKLLHELLSRTLF